MIHFLCKVDEYALIWSRVTVQSRCDRQTEAASENIVKPIWNNHPGCQEKWYFQTGGHSKQVQFTWNPIIDRIFQKSENVLSRVVFQEGVIPDRFH